MCTLIQQLNDPSATVLGTDSAFGLGGNGEFIVRLISL
jgi:hypothetical protein